MVLPSGTYRNKNMNASKPFELPSNHGGNLSKRLGGNVGCKDENSSWDIIGLQYVLQYVCVFSSHSFWTSSSLDVPVGVIQEEGRTGFFFHLPSAVRAFIFLARRIQPFFSLVDREVDFCVLTI